MPVNKERLMSDSQKAFPPRMQVVAGAAVRRGNELLFVRQTYGHFKGQWCFPCGFVDDGEQPEAAAIREAREESGIEAKIMGFLSVTTLTSEHGPLLYLVFLCDHLAGEPTPDGSENDKAAYFSLELMNQFNEPFEAQNAWLARRIFAGDYQLMRPVQNSAWHSMYLNTYI
jgi:ADP-ribose pyrophosphatase YjhB (NUDIX family)